ncbi:MAG: hypothetical protein PHU91_01755 [Candidatus Omnitrophica bacterium]|nr:hypothetical protein [Candidatus Omnitrophota bacterium]MDD5236380.1 hypothetical protein [Candidatus Omnitrophota bacterium]MDD5611391.1 hypothetical protein [Candidatus Omnitrophota bacterium]
MEWEKQTEEKFKNMVAKIPIFHRHIAEEAVVKRAEDNAKARGAVRITEEDVVSAFFCDVPSPFYSMMIRLLEQGGFDYKKYGFPKNANSK